MPEQDRSVAEPRVLVLIIAWNRADELRACLASFPCVTYSNYEILVVDNASADDTVPMVRREFPHVSLVANEQNLGYVGGSNIGFQYAAEHGAEYVLLLNQDTKMTPDVISELLRPMQTDARIAATGAKNLLMENPAYTWGKYGVITWGPMLVHTVGRYELDRPEPSPKDVEWLIGNGCMFSTAALQRIGFFDPEFFHLNEDVEWCTRARGRGYRVVYVDSAAILHKGSSSADIMQPVVFTYGYFIARNAILFARRHAGPLQWAQLATLMTLGLAIRVSWALLSSVIVAAKGQSPFIIGVFDGFEGRLRRERITVINRSQPRSPGIAPRLDRFLRWAGA